MDNYLFENLYKKIKELNVDILQFAAYIYDNKNKIKKVDVKIPPNVLITQPELKVAFLEKIGKNRLVGCATRQIWNKFVKEKYF